MKTTKMLAILVLALGQAAEVANADFTFSNPTNPGPPVNSSYGDFSPSISADGCTLYFASDRPGGIGIYDIWMSTRASTDNEWSDAVNLGSPVNTSGYELFPSISADGLTLYFGRGIGPGAHILVTTRSAIGEPWSEPVEIGPTITSPAGDGWPNISADDCTLYFASDRPDGSGGRDIWVTMRPTTKDLWSPPVNLGPTINSAAIDAGPSISADDLVLLFFSNRSGGHGEGDLYMTTREEKDGQWSSSVNLGPIINSANNDILPSLSADGRSLYFCDHPFLTHRSGGLGGGDIWYVPIDPIVDFNGDGIVDSADMCIMVEQWHTDEPLCDIGPMPWGDGIVDVQDLIVLAEHLLTYPGAVAYWKLDETEGSIAADSIADSHGILYGDPVWEPNDGIVDSALRFDGIDDYVSTPFVLNPTDGAFSVVAWVKGGGTGQVVISQIDGANWLLTDSQAGALMTGLKDSDRSAVPLQSQTVITDGNWHRVGFVWDGSQRILYVDDVEAAIDTQSGLGGSEGGLYIGAGKTLDAGSFFSGLIDDVRIYNRAVRP